MPTTIIADNLQSNNGFAFGPASLVAADAALTLTAAQLIGGYIHCIPTAARNYTTDTAANIIAALGDQPGGKFMFWIRNDSAGAFAITLVAGAGVTLFAGNTNTIAQAHTRMFLCEIMTSTTVNIYSMMDSAH
jgi:hypothetical protein